jgi:small-conductance mechanosensitive channel/CRP-like cAMP-binding protein
MEWNLRAVLIGTGLLVGYLLFSLLQRRLGRYRYFKSIAVSANLTVLLIAVILFLVLNDLSPGEQAGLWLISLAAFFGVLLLVKTLEFVAFDWFLARRGEVKFPQLLRDILRWLLAVTLFFVILRVNLGIDLTPLVATSAALTFVLGFAMQDVLGNLFAGIIINLERPFSIGEWVNVNNRDGRVVSMTWRATRLQTFSGDIIVIPNSEISKNAIINYSTPTRLHARYVTMGVACQHPPNRVKTSLERALQNTPGVRREPAPRIFFSGFGESAVNYRVKFWVDEFPMAADVEDALQSEIWYQFRRDRIEIPFPIRDVRLKSPAEDTRVREAERLERMASLLKKVSLLNGLSENELRDLAGRLEAADFARGEWLARQGEPGASLTIIESGTVEVLVHDPGGKELQVARLGPVDFFGEMSLLTGEPRQAGVRALADVEAVSIRKEDIGPLLVRNPQAAAELSRIMAERQQHNLQAAAQVRAVSEQEQQQASSENILERIRRFFDLGGG